MSLPGMEEGEIAAHPCYYARSYMAALAEAHNSTELPFALRSHLRIASSPYVFRRAQGLQGALKLLAQQQPTEYAPHGDGPGTTGLPASPTSGTNFVTMSLQTAFPRRDANLIFAGIAPEVAVKKGYDLANWSTVYELFQDRGLGAKKSSGIARTSGGGAADGGAAAAVSDVEQELKRREAEVQHALNDVSLYEQHLALRVVQGLCTLFPDQRHYAADGSLFPVVLEAINTYQQYLEEVALPAQSQNTQASSPDSNHGHSSSNLASTTNSVNLTSGFVPTSPRDIEQLSVLLAMMDAVEAACHYSTHCVTTFVNLHGVRYFLAAAANPIVPGELRRSILHFFSLLVNETQCQNRLVDQGLAGALSRDSSPASNPSPTAAAKQAATRPKGADGWPNRASASKFFHSLTDVLKQMLVVETPSNASIATSTGSGAQSQVPQVVAHAILQLGALVNVQGTQVSSKLSRSDLSRLIHKLQRQREQTMGEFLAMLEGSQLSKERSGSA